MKIQLEIKALSPLAIGRQKPGGSVSESESYIPGSVIRGAVAAQILPPSNQPAVNLTQNSAFQSLFLSDAPALFQNAYPAIAKMGDESEVRELPSQILVLPATALSCKTNSGFTPKKHGVFDTLIDRFCAATCNHAYDPNCPKCSNEGRVEPLGGFYSHHSNQYYQHSVSTRLLTRVGINRRRATAEEQVLYSIEVLNEVEGKNHQPAVYRSSILIEDEELANAVAEFINNHTFRLGGSASRGLGKVAIEATVAKIEHQVKTRIDNFNQTLQQRWRKWREIFSLQATEEGRTYFTLDLQADAILTENWQRTTVISPTMLQQFAGVEDPSLQLHVAYSSYDYRSGWNAAWGLMKDMELVTNKGAVYLFSTASPNPWKEALERLEIRGVGDRTAEGFGQIQVCNEFHLVFREQAV